MRLQYLFLLLLWFEPSIAQSCCFCKCSFKDILLGSLINEIICVLYLTRLFIVPVSLPVLAQKRNAFQGNQYYFK